jgi:Uma2 family endonuclease
MQSAMTLAAEQIRKCTPEDLLGMPDAIGYELVDGALVERHVSKESSRIALRIGALLDAAARRTGEAEVYGPDLGYRCFRNPNDVRKPDVSVVRRERVAQLEKPDPGYMPIVPDLAVEVLSPNDLALELDFKLRDYREARVPLIWLVNPQARSVAIYSIEGAFAILGENDEITAAPALTQFRSKVSAFF